MIEKDVAVYCNNGDVYYGDIVLVTVPLGVLKSQFVFLIHLILLFDSTSFTCIMHLIWFYNFYSFKDVDYPLAENRNRIDYYYWLLLFINIA